MRLAACRLSSITRPPARPSLWLELADEEGRVGVGEASPLPPFSPDDIVTCERALTSIHARLGEVDLGVPAALAVERALLPVEGAFASAPAARFALETALFDLLGKRSGASIAELLGGPRPYHEVPVNGLLFASPDPEGLPARAAALAGAGAAVIKVKLRASDEAGFARELAALSALRERLPLPFELRLDPNAAYSLAEAHARLAALACVAPRFVEQPVAPDELPHLGRCAVPWAADESLLLPELVEGLLGAPGCAAVILKPAVLGGLLRARAIAERALSRGLDVVVTHLFDGPVAMASAAELALSLSRSPLASGLDRHDGLAAYPPLAVPALARRFWVTSHGGAGLGIDPAPLTWP